MNMSSLILKLMKKEEELCQFKEKMKGNKDKEIFF